VLKIDRSFVERVDQGPEESSLARAIVRLAQTLHLSAVAEGVESEVQLDWLREVGCTYAQGYHVSRPVEPDAIVPWLSGPDRLARTEVEEVQP
jgi:EAL domain-containing protein (putative c-di-GMP-specific phosphodiesterase class I)